MRKPRPETGVTDARQVVPNWLPDETVFSICSRIHVLTGHAADRSTCLALFGHPRQGSQHDLPARLSHFSQIAPDRLGSPSSIIRDHTLLGFYLPLRPPAFADVAMAAMAGDAIGSLKYRLGLLTSRFRAHHPLKSCPVCRTEDRHVYQVAYWHVSHQLPGAWVCPHHGEPLQESRLKSNGVGRFHWLLPSGTTWRSPLQSPSSLVTGRLVKLAEGATALHRLPPGYLLDQPALRATYLEALEQAGFAKGGRVHHALAAQALVDSYRPLRHLDELQALPATEAQASAMLTRLVSVHRMLTHPLWHLAAIEFLFGGWQAFRNSFESHRRSAATPGTTGPAASLKTIRSHPRKAAALALLKNGATSCRSVALSVGVDTGTVMAWATAAGVTVGRRPKQLTKPKRAALVKALRRGTDKAEAATRHQVSVQTVTRLLRTEVGLQTAWHTARHARAQADARHAWSSASKRKTTLGAKAIRALAPAAYAWLYRNDRAWLQGQIATLPKVPAGNHAGTNWRHRDAELSRLVSQAIEDLGARATLQRVYQAVPALKAKLGQLDRLPMTSALLAPVRRRQHH